MAPAPSRPAPVPRANSRHPRAEATPRARTGAVSSRERASAIGVSCRVRCGVCLRRSALRLRRGLAGQLQGQVLGVADDADSERLEPPADLDLVPLETFHVE